MGFRRTRFFNRAQPSQEPVTLPTDLAERLQALRVAILANGSCATDWEKTFIDSIVAFHGQRGSLTAAQFGTFQKIEKKFSPEAKKAATDWTKTFSAADRERYRVACEYYGTTPYYGFAIKEYREHVAAGTFGTFVPSLASFRALTDNKFFAKIWAAFNAQAIFACGDLVRVSKLNSRGRNTLIALGSIALVVKASENVPNSPAVGSKLYEIQLLSDGRTHLAEERFLKRVK